MKSPMLLKQFAIGVVLVAVLSSCSTTRSDKAAAKKALKPAELSKITELVRVSRLWSTSVGDGGERIGAYQAPVVADGKVYAAAVDGGVYALDLQSGKQDWRFRPQKEKGKSALRLAGGPAVGEGLVVIGSLEGVVIALDAATGTEKWRANVPNEVITAPAVGQGMVFVRSNDGRVTAFSADTGRQLWFNVQDMPSLTVRGNAPMVTGPGVLFMGNDDGTMTTLAMQDGRFLWDQIIGMPEGRTELDRMADVDGAVGLDGTTLYATSFKNETVSIEGPTGRLLWMRDHGGVPGVGLSLNSVVVSDQAGTVWSLDKNGGSTLWSQDVLARRSPTGPAVQGGYAVVADFEGFVHWLKLENGEIAARGKASGGAIRAQPYVSGDVVLVQSVKGKLTAFRLNQ